MEEEDELDMEVGVFGELSRPVGLNAGGMERRGDEALASWGAACRRLPSEKHNNN